MLKVLYYSFFASVITDELVRHSARQRTDLAPPTQTEQQPGASPGAGEMPMDSNLESPSGGKHAGEPNAAPGRLGGSDRLTANKSVTAPSAMSGPGVENLTAPRA